MDRKTFSIGTLSLTAVILFVACLFPGKPANGAFAVKDLRGTQLITVESQTGGDILYVIDPQSAKILVLGFNNTTKDLRTVAVGDLNQFFAGK